MSDATCSVNGCGKPRDARGWCSAHYGRFRRYGDPLFVPVKPTVAERFHASLKTDPCGCWLWRKRLDPDGYGRFRSDAGTVLAHRWSYEHHVGPIPKGLVIDHLCRNRACVNPSHLEPVTQAENIMRGSSQVASNHLKTGCPHGHPYSGDNLGVTANGSRFCRTCKRSWDRAYRLRSAS